MATDLRPIVIRKALTQKLGSCYLGLILECQMELVMVYSPL